MKYLTIIRHAKSSWDDMSLADHDRPLNKRGQRDAPRMVEALEDWFTGHQNIPRPDCLLSSTALRAMTTAGFFAEVFGKDSELQLNSALYHASSATLLTSCSQIEEHCSHALIFGHNPGMHEFAGRLKGGWHEHFPTCALSMMELGIEHWGNIEEGCAEELLFLYPKAL